MSLDHKVIGVQYTVTSLFLLAVGGIFALLFRTELAEPGLQFLSLQQYNTLMSLHGILMIVGILVGVAGVMNYVVPMAIGARDMAFPRLNAFSYWVVPPSMVLLALQSLPGRFRYGLDRISAALGASAARDADVLPGRMVVELVIHPRRA